MLREALSATGITPNRAAGLLGVNPEIFQEWVAEQRSIPYSYETLLSTIIGVDLSARAKQKSYSKELAEITPAIWYRFRDKNLVDEDREYVFLIRQLGYFIHELEEVTNSKFVGWKSLFQDIRSTIDKQAPPRVQGRQAAQIFRDNRGLSTGATGIGEVIRGNLRSMGIVVIETPIPESLLEGCCFFVGGQTSERPCIFANSHHSTWFRRNVTIMHEVAHAIFDAESSGAMLDFRNSNGDSNISEERADSFAHAVLVPAKVLQHVAQTHGINWSDIKEKDLATLVATIQVGQRTILRAALASNLISPEQHKQYSHYSISENLRKLSDRALPAREYIKKIGRQDAEWLCKRNTTIPSKRLRLPSFYIDKVIEAYRSYQISGGKAAEMLMIDKNTFAERFGFPEEPLDE